MELIAGYFCAASFMMDTLMSVGNTTGKCERVLKLDTHQRRKTKEKSGTYIEAQFGGNLEPDCCLQGYGATLLPRDSFVG